MPKKITVDPQQVVELAKIGCTTQEIAVIVRCSVDTLDKRFSKEMEEGRTDMKEKLRRAQFKLALAGNVTMLIWLGKQMLKQTDVVMPEVKKEELDNGRAALIEELKKQ